MLEIKINFVRKGVFFVEYGLIGYVQNIYYNKKYC